PLTLTALKRENPVTLTATPGGRASLAVPKIVESVILVSPSGRALDVRLPLIVPKMATATVPSRVPAPLESSRRSLELNRAMVFEPWWAARYGCAEGVAAARRRLPHSLQNRGPLEGVPQLGHESICSIFARSSAGPPDRRIERSLAVDA